MVLFISFNLYARLEIVQNLYAEFKQKSKTLILLIKILHIPCLLFKQRNLCYVESMIFEES